MKTLLGLWTVICVMVGYYLFFSGSDGGGRQKLIYDESVNGQQQIAAALVAAKTDHKMVLLQFGANWCVWCHRLHDFFAADTLVKQELANNYAVVLVDVNQGRNADVVEKYGHPTALGLPVLVVLDADGRQLTTQGTVELVDASSGQYDSERVVAFLKKWAEGK